MYIRIMYRKEGYVPERKEESFHHLLKGYILIVEIFIVTIKAQHQHSISDGVLIQFGGTWMHLSYPPHLARHMYIQDRTMDLKPIVPETLAIHQLCK